MPNGNIFEVAFREIADLFAPLLRGPLGSEALVLGITWPNEEARNAIISSLAALGYGKNAASFVSLSGQEADAAAAKAAEIVLDAHSLFTLVEGLDPSCVIALDVKACALLAEAYRNSLEPNKFARLAGRNIVAFSDFASMMSTPEKKQHAWALLKKLPKRN